MDATMRIAMVGHKRVPSREGGIEVVVEELAARMVIHGHTVTCYNRSGITSAAENMTLSIWTSTGASASSICPPSTARASQL